MLNSLKNKIKMNIAGVIEYYNEMELRKKIIVEKAPIVFMLDTPTHGNLGDHAIAVAQKRFIQSINERTLIVEIPFYMVKIYLPFLKRNAKKSDIFLMVGGGNFGDLYPEYDQSRRKICNTFPNNKIIVFPQTIYYRNKCRQNEDVAKSINAHEDITLCARDNNSFSLLKKLFPNKGCILTPDIVMSLPFYHKTFERKGILCCFRTDIEKNETCDHQSVIKYLKMQSYSIDYTDTVLNTGISVQEREERLSNLLDQFSSHEIIITDRLHGMIFSYITRTPCIVFDNSYHKIFNYYQTWFSDLPYVAFAESDACFADIFIKIAGLNYKYPTYNYFQNSFLELREIVEKSLEKY